MIGTPETWAITSTRTNSAPTDVAVAKSLSVYHYEPVPVDVYDVKAA